MFSDFKKKREELRKSQRDVVIMVRKQFPEQHLTFDQSFLYKVEQRNGCLYWLGRRLEWLYDEADSESLINLARLMLAMNDNENMTEEQFNQHFEDWMDRLRAAVKAYESVNLQ